MAADRKIIRYKPTPTLAKFHANNAPVRGVMGPIGSGKSVGMCWEIYTRALEQRPGPDGVRRSRWAIARNCYDDQTEILTEDGWRLFKDLEEGQKVAQLEDDGRLAFVEPSYYYKAPYVGELIGFEGEGVDFRVTPDHKMYVATRHGRQRSWTGYRLEKARGLYGKRNVRVMRDLPEWDGAAHGMSPDLFEWLGFWFADGNIGETRGRDGYARRRLSVIQAKDLEYVRDLMMRAEVPYTEVPKESGGAQFRVSLTAKGNGPGDKIYDLLKEAGLQPVRAMPAALKNAPREHLRRFIHGYMRGDGNYGTSAVAWTSSRQLANDLQEIALRAGMVANVRLVADQVGQAVCVNGAVGQVNAPQYSVTFVTEKKHRPVLNKQKGRYRGWYREAYSGVIYCVEVPTHRVYVRRNGVAMWCSQTYPELKSTTIKTWLDWFGEYGPIKWDSPITHRIRTADLDLEVLFMSLDKPRDVKKVLSLELTGAFANEARELPLEVIHALQMRVGRYPSVRDGGCSWSGLIMDTNPPDDMHWWYEQAEEVSPENWAFFKQPGALIQYGDGDGVDYAPNPAAENVENQPKGFDYWMDLIPGKEPNWIKAYILGQYSTVLAGKAIYGNQWRDDLHVSPNQLGPIRGRGIMLAWDYGLTPACLILQTTPRGQLRVLEEIVGEGIGIAQLVDGFVSPLLASKYSSNPVELSVGDPAGANRNDNDEKAVFDTLREKGLPTVAGPTQSPVKRLEAVRKYLTRLADQGRPALLLDPRCKLLRAGFNGGYRYRELATGGTEKRYADKPEKNRFSHCHDALQYLCSYLDKQQTIGTRAPAIRPYVGIGDKVVGF